MRAVLKMRSVPRPVKLALLLVIAALITGGASTPLAWLTSGSITVTARFDNAAGVFTGNPVAVLGMRVGEITDVKQRGVDAEVTMSIDSSVQIPADATAVIISDSVLTSRHIEFTPVYRGGPTLQDEAVLEIDRTRTPVEFDSLLAMAQRLSTSLSGDEEGHGPVADMIGVGAAVTSNNGDDIRAALDQLSQALRMGDDRGLATKNAITTLVTNLDSLATTAATNDQTIREFGTGVRQLSDLLAGQEFGTGDTGAKLNQILIQTIDLMQKNRGALKDTANGANVIFKSLADYDRELSEFMTLFPLVVDNGYFVIDQEIGAGRVHVNVDKISLDGQMIKEVCNLLDLKQLGCNTGRMSDMGPDFGVVSMLAGIAGMAK